MMMIGKAVDIAAVAVRHRQVITAVQPRVTSHQRKPAVVVTMAARDITAVTAAEGHSTRNASDGYPPPVLTAE